MTSLAHLARRPFGADTDSSRRIPPLLSLSVRGLLATTLVVVGGALAGAADPDGTGRLWSVPAVPVRPAISLVPALAVYFGGLIIMVRTWLLLRRHHLAKGLTVGALTLTVALWSLPFLVGPPLGSRDVYAYAAQGRMADQGYDVYRSGPAELGPDDPVLAAVDPLYHDVPSLYGPLFVSVSSGIAGVVDDHVINAVLAFRLLAILGLVASAFAVYDLSRGFGRDPVDALVLVIANPLVLLHLVSGAHNEAIMLGFLLGGVAAARRGHIHVAVVLCTMAAAIKLPAILAVAFVGLSWTMLDTRWERRFARLGLIGAESILVMGLAGRLTGLGWDWASAVVDSDPVDAYLSVTRLVGGGMSVLTGVEAERMLTTARLTGMFAAAAITGLLLIRRHQSWPTALAWSLLIAAIMHPTTQPWYLTWGIVLLAATSAGERNRGLVTCCAVAVFVVLPIGPELGWVLLDDLRPFSLVAATLVLLVLTFSPGDAHTVRRRSDLSADLVSIVVPTRHEGPNIGPLIAELDAAIASEAWPSAAPRAEVVFVDDSDDETPTIVRALADARPEDAALRVELLHRHQQQRWGGLGGAVVDGFGVAEGRWVVVMDGDLQHPASKVPELVQALMAPTAARPAVVAVASRRVDGGSFGDGLTASRRRVSSSLAALARAMFPRRLGRITDPLSGFFAVRLDQIDLSRLHPDGFKILIEVLGSHDGLSTVEVPFEFTGRLQGMSKASASEGARYVGHLVDLRVRTSRLWAGAVLTSSTPTAEGQAVAQG